MQWQQLRHGAHDGPVIALDGKALKGSHSTHLVGALNLGSQRWLDVERVPDKTNEIPTAQTLIARLELDEMIAVLDALHTQTQTARGIVQEQGGDYVLCLKGNQPGLQRQAQTLLPASFPPRHVEIEDNRSRRVDPAQLNFPHAAPIARLERTRHRNDPNSEPEVVWLITRLGAAPADEGKLLELARAYWGIENGGHGRLDGSAFEDGCRVRQPVAATALGWLRRFVHGEYAAWSRRQTCARARTQPTFFARVRGDPAAVRFVTTLAARL